MALAGIAAASSERVYIANDACSGHAYRPHSVVLACGDGNLIASKITYQSYGPRTATATATFSFNVCEPNCAEGTRRHMAGTLEFRAVVRCDDGRLYFSRARYLLRTGTSGTANISPFQRCSKPLRG